MINSFWCSSLNETVNGDVDPIPTATLGRTSRSIISPTDNPWVVVFANATCVVTVETILSTLPVNFLWSDFNRYSKLLSPLPKKNNPLSVLAAPTLVARPM